MPKSVLRTTINGPEAEHNRIFLFDARGVKLWEKNTDNRWAVEVEFSVKSSWIFLTYLDIAARTFGIAIIITQNGSIAHDLSQSNLLHPAISTDEKYFLAKGRNPKERPGERFALFEIQTGTKLFENFSPKPIIDYVIFSDEEVIYVLHQSEMVKLDMTGAVVGSYAFEKLETPQNRLRIEGGSTPDQVFIRGHTSFIDLSANH